MTGRAAVGLPKCPAESCFVAIFLAAVQGVLLDHLQKKSAQKMQCKQFEQPEGLVSKMYLLRYVRLSVLKF